MSLVVLMFLFGEFRSDYIDRTPRRVSIFGGANEFLFFVDEESEDAPCMNFTCGVRLGSHHHVLIVLSRAWALTWACLSE